MPDWQALRDHLNREGRVSKEHCHKILNDTMEIFSKLIITFLRMRTKFDETEGSCNCSW